MVQPITTTPKNCDPSVKKAIQQLNKKLSHVNFYNFTASRLVATDSNQQLTSVSNLASWVSGTANEIDVTNDGDGTITLGIINPLIVAKGGSGAAAFTDHSILLGSDTQPFTALGLALNGQIPIGFQNSDPVLAFITGTANQITVTNGAGSIGLALPQDIHTGASPTFTQVTLSTDPTNVDHSVTKSYADALVAGAFWNDVTVGTIANVDLSNGLEAGDTIDDYVLVEGDRVLVKEQTDQTENGLYVVPASGAASRAADADTAAEIEGKKCIPLNGTVTQHHLFFCITGDITLGVTDIKFAEVTMVAAHNVLTGIQGGTTNQYYHLTLAEHTALAKIPALTYVSDSFIKITEEDTYAIRTIAETKTDLSLNNVENTTHSTDAHTMTIDGVDVSAHAALNIHTAVADESADTECYVSYFIGATGDLAPKTGTNLTFNSSTGILTATGFAGALTGSVTGDCTGSSGSCTGESATVATIDGLAPNTATTQATQASITTCANLVTVGTIGTGVWNAGAVTSSGVGVFEGASVTVGKASTTTGTLVLHDSNSANTITLTVPDISVGSLTFTLPPTDGANTNVLQTDGNGVLTWAAAGAGGGSGFGRPIILTPQCGMPPATSFATLDTIAGGSTPAESISVLDFDPDASEYMDFKIALPDGYEDGGLTLTVIYSMTSDHDEGTPHKVRWEAGFARIADDALDMNSDQAYAFNGVSDTVPSVVGEVSYATITFTDGADMDSLAAGEMAILRIYRDHDHADDNATGDAELQMITIKEN